jgi:DNA-directed RNA polymerase specialized sigma subunit
MVHIQSANIKIQLLFRTSLFSGCASSHYALQHGFFQGQREVIQNIMTDREIVLDLTRSGKIRRLASPVRVDQDLLEMIDELEIELGRPVQDEEVAAKLGLSLQEFARLVKQALAGEPAPKPRPGHKTQGFANKVAKQLSRKEQEVIMLYYVEKFDHQEIGMALGYSEMHVVEILQNIKDRLRTT